MQRRSRTGLTLIEIVVAILVLSVGALAFAGSSAVMVRRLAESARGAAAASAARSRLESSFARACDVLTSGSEQSFGVRSDWSVTGSGRTSDIRQRITYPTLRGSRNEDFLTTAPCQ